MRYADDQDLGSDGFTAQERSNYRYLRSTRDRAEASRAKIIATRLLASRHCPAAVPALERAEANVVTAIEEMRRDLAVMMGDEV